MQLVVLRAVMTEAMMLPMIWRMVFHVSLFFMINKWGLRVSNLEGSRGLISPLR